MSTNLPSINSTASNRTLNLLKEAIGRGGGVFIGVQMGLEPAVGSELWFTNPNTGRALSIPFDPITDFRIGDVLAAVKLRIMNDDAAEHRRKVSIHVTVLRHVADTLLKLTQEITALYEEKK